MNQVAEFDDFSGGMTDNVVDCPPNKYELAVNFFTTKNNKLQMRSGSGRDNTAAPQINTDRRINCLIPFGTDLLKQHSRDIDVIIANVMTTLVGPTGNPLFASGASTSVVSFSIWNKFAYLTNDSLGTRPQKIYRDETGTFQIRNMGLPTVGGPPVITPAGGSGPDVTYLYRFVRRNSYTREGNVLFEMLGPADTEVSVTGKTIESTGTNTIDAASIPTLDNGVSQNYDTANSKIDVYRTTANGVNFFFLTTMDNGSAVDYVDNTVDDDLINRALLYTEGGVFNNDEPPVSKYLHLTERAAYYANILDGGEYLSNEVRQSRPGIFEAVPASFSVQVDGEIVGISSARDIPVVFCKDSIYRIDGIIDDFGQGQMIAVKISDKIGCAGHSSIVRHLDTIYFAGSNGFYATDGFDVRPLSADLQNTFSTLVQTDNQKRAICGAFEANERRIWWGCNPSNNIDNDSIFVLDLDQPIVGGQSSFTILNGKQFDNEGNEIDFDWTVSSLAYFRDKICRATLNGYTFVHDQTLFSDEKLSGAEWIQKPIMYDFKSGVMSLGTPSLRKFMPMIVVNAEPTSNVTCLIESSNNKLLSFVSLKEIYEKPLKQWGDSYWGDPVLWRNPSSMIRQRRFFPNGNLWCFYKQVRFRNAFSIVTSSDVRGRATVVGGTSKTISVVGANTFPPQCIDYYIQILLEDGETWSDELRITGQPSATELEFDDPDLVAPDGIDLTWRIKGYFKGDGLKLTSYSLHYDAIAPTPKGDNSSGSATA